MNEVYENAKVFILENGNEVQNKLFLHLIGESDLSCAIEALKRYQNEDGGWANGLEIEYNGNVSTPMTTAAALGYIYFFDLLETELLSRTLHYLKSTQKENGSWDDPKEITRFELPPYMGPGIYVEFKTGMIIKWLSRLNLNIEDREMIIRARDYLIEEFPQVSKGDDIWSAIAYINAFGELPPLEQSEHIQQIMGWAMSILMPDGPPDPDTDELEWTFVQGMIHDDNPVLDSMKEKVAHAIVANQLQSGGWQHQFGMYNAVWAAILIVRFLWRNGSITIA
ncbi:MAG: hypothetical protein K8R25_16565 [Methanosarcinales archaeon]|nr:hypothetical protein [Methanosarcinales archaeon]